MTARSLERLSPERTWSPFSFRINCSASLRWGMLRQLASHNHFLLRPSVRTVMSGTPKPLIAVVGTTGTGKSQLGIELALALQRQSSLPPGLDFGRWKGAKVINADAMQVYRGLDIVTNKVTEEEKQGVEHLLMDFKDPSEEYFVSQWIKDTMNEVSLSFHANTGHTDFLCLHFFGRSSDVMNRINSPLSSAARRTGYNTSYFQIGWCL